MIQFLAHLLLASLFVGCASNTKKVTSYYKTEQIAEQGTYKNGKRNGKWIYYYENGQKKKEGKYNDGWKDGLWIEWYENGQKRVECRHNGAIIHPESGTSVHNGKFTVWTKEGLIKKEGNYINGISEWENNYDDPNSYTKVDTTK